MKSSEIEINDKATVFIYKERWFTGFSPCFDNNLYSLACCKGRKRGGGMREVVCRNKNIIAK